MSGLFAVNKPSGISSAGLLNDLQHILKRSPLFETEIQAQQARVNAGRKGRKQKMGNKIKMGHGGTLDPLASGVLVVGTGRGTKELGKFLSCSKDYEAIALFGCSTDTYDSEGKIVHKRSCKHISRDVLEAALVQFRGDIMQTPPIYSALKMQGKPLYEYAREGKPLPAEIKARPATVSRFEVTQFTTKHDWKMPQETAAEDIVLSAEALEKLQPNLKSVPESTQESRVEPKEDSDPVPVAGSIDSTRNDEQSDLDDKEKNNQAPNAPDEEPKTKKLRLASPVLETGSEEDLIPVQGAEEETLVVHISMTVSSGTYVRSLIHDLGLALGSAAHMVALVRKRVGEFTLEEAVPWDDFVADKWQDSLRSKLDFGEEGKDDL